MNLTKKRGTYFLNPIILYNYTPATSGENAEQLLKGIELGFYLSDGRWLLGLQ